MKDSKPGFIRRFFSFIGSAITWLRNTLANLLFLVVLLFIVAAMWPKESAVLPNDVALRLNLTGTLVDQLSYADPISQIINPQSDYQPETLVSDVIKAIDGAKDDDRINSLVLELQDLEAAGLSKMHEIGAALERFRSTGKPIYAVSGSYSQAQYFLASYANTIYLAPMGNVGIMGFASYANYFKAALDKLHIKAHVFRVGEYKDAVEPLLRNDMSPASKEHHRKLLAQLWTDYQQGLEARRELTPGTIHDYADNLDKNLQAFEGNPSALALDKGLVDEVLSRQEVEDSLERFIGASDKGNTYRHVDFRTYLRMHSHVFPQGDAIGLITATGAILDGEQPEGSIGSTTMIKMLDRAANNYQLKGLVIRVDSPGGSAFASEEIRNAIQRVKVLRGEKFPVYISMGSVAASGGYWISMAGDQIWATPTTITGSIGVFGIIPTVDESLAKLGISTDGVETTQFAALYRPDRPMPERSKRLFQSGVDHIYQQFLTIVADARNKTTDEVHAVAQGRIWTGTMAKEIGLVDELGNLEDVVAAAADAAGLSTYRVEPVTRVLSPKELFLRQLSQQVIAWVPTLSIAPSPDSQAAFFVRQMGEKVWTQLQLLRDPNNIYAQCMTCDISL